MTVQLCTCYNWNQMNLCYCSAAVSIYFLCVFVNCFVAYIAMVSRGVIIGMSGESWCHKSTLSLVPGSQDWACRSSSLVLCFILRHFFLYLYLVSNYYLYKFYLFIYIFKF